MPLVKYGPKPKDRRLRKLLEGAGGGSGEDSDRDGGDGGGNNMEAMETRGGSSATSAKGSYISFWKPEVSKQAKTKHSRDRGASGCVYSSVRTHVCRLPLGGVWVWVWVGPKKIFYTRRSSIFIPVTVPCVD